MEIDGPNAEQLVFVLYGKILQDEDNSKKKENLSLSRIKLINHIFLILKVRDLLTTHAQKGS